MIQLQKLLEKLEKNYNYEVVTLCWFVLAELNMLLEGYKYFFVLKSSVWNIKSNYCTSYRILP